MFVAGKQISLVKDPKAVLAWNELHLAAWHESGRAWRGTLGLEGGCEGKILSDLDRGKP